MNIEKAISTPGWMSETELTYLAELASKSRCIAEIGSWRGRSARAFAENTPGMLFCVDTWADNAYGIEGWWTENDGPDFCNHPNWLWNEFHKNTGDLVNVIPIRMASTQAADVCARMGLKFDLIFIDAGHFYENVRDDIAAWNPLLRKGGVICGHDYGHVPDCGVVRAVDEVFPRVSVTDSIWTAL